ncbi:MAG: ParB/RepB/Spo0J family partition protein [Nostoc sp.]|uniref:ParB/RepB/Spo0J family partition protein n=1 Tax=Nostoc sp. TaxID=1180 RepID=UPI002FF8ED63
MISDLAVLQKREKELTELLSKRDSSTFQERKSLQKQLESLREQMANLVAFEKLRVGQYVFKGQSMSLGRVTAKTPGHQPTVFVSWNDVPIPEQPRLLELDEIANSGIVKVGDIVRVADRENGKIIGYALEKVQSLQAHGWIEVSNNEIVSTAHWQMVEVEDFDRWDFNWIVGEAISDTDNKNWIGIKSAIARASRNTANLALEWIKQYSKDAKGIIEALEKRLRQLENPVTSLPPLEYLRELKVVMPPPIAAMKVDAAAVDRLLHIAVAAVTAKELDVAECLIADAERFANSKGLRLKVNMDGWLITPLCKTAEEALALCPMPGDRVMAIGENGNSRLGSLEGYDASSVQQAQALVRWDDGSTSKENGFVLETLPPLLEYLASIENPIVEASMLDSEIEPGSSPTEEILAVPANPNMVEMPIEISTQSPLPLGIQEILIWELRSHPINSTIYGEEEDDTTLDEMIQNSGWIKTLLVTPDRYVVGGNRRLRIARKLGLEKVLIEVREFASDEAVIESLLLDNAVREKTVEQKVREARCWLPIESEKAKKIKECSENRENFPGASRIRQVRDIVSARVGLGSGKNLEKAEKVLTAIEALKGVDSVAAEGLRNLVNNKSIHAAYRLVCESEERLKWQPKVGNQVTVSLKAEHHAGASGTIASIEKSISVVNFDPPSEGMSQDQIYLNLLLPADVAAQKAKQKAEREAAKPETRFGLQEQPGGGLLPEKDRNEGFDPNATPCGNGQQNVIPSNVINLPLRKDENVVELDAQTSESSTSVAMEIAMGIRYLSPKELAEAIIWAAEDDTNPLTDNHLGALYTAVTKIWEKRHPTNREVAN